MASNEESGYVQSRSKRDKQMDRMSEQVSTNILKCRQHASFCKIIVRYSSKALMQSADSVAPT
eukprot:11945250-Ditylum_brightwellii.AAC.1